MRLIKTELECREEWFKNQNADWFDEIVSAINKISNTDEASTVVSFLANTSSDEIFLDEMIDYLERLGYNVSFQVNPDAIVASRVWYILTIKCK